MTPGPFLSFETGYHFPISSILNNKYCHYRILSPYRRGAFCVLCMQALWRIMRLSRKVFRFTSVKETP